MSPIAPAEHRRALQHAARVKRRAERLGAIADRLLDLVGAATEVEPAQRVGGNKKGRGPGRKKIAARRAQALHVLAGLDLQHAVATPPVKSLPAGLLSQALTSAMQAARLALEHTEMATSLDVRRAGARAEAVARGNRLGDLDARKETRARGQQKSLMGNRELSDVECAEISGGVRACEENSDPLAHLFTHSAPIESDFLPVLARRDQT
jgi:hypothetical protein